MNIVQAPPPALVRVGSLLAAAITPTSPLDRTEETGYRGPACSGWTTFDPCGTEVVPSAVDPDEQGNVVSSMPYGIIATDECTTFGGTLEEHQSRARARLEAVESAGIAHELWTGDLAVAAADGDAESPWAFNPRLAAGGAVTDVNSGGAVAPKIGLGLLEQALGEMLAQNAGTIHIARSAFPFLPDLEINGDVVTTRLGTRVIADAGYPGTDPDGDAPSAGQAWVYGTARPAVHRSNVAVTPGSLAEAVDRDVNTARFTAERLVAASFPCGVVAVRITLT